LKNDITTDGLNNIPYTGFFSFGKKNVSFNIIIIKMMNRIIEKNPRCFCSLENKNSIKIKIKIIFLK
jgi:hypothetical protein